MRAIQRTMGTMRSVVLVLVALSVALTAGPAAAAQRGRDEGFRGGHREERVTHERHIHERWEHRDFRFAYPAPYVAPYCSTQPGYWAWDGWQHLWVPPQTVCQ